MRIVRRLVLPRLPHRLTNHLRNPYLASTSCRLDTRYYTAEEIATHFVLVDFAMLKDLFAHVRCGKCGLAAPDLRKADQQYGLAVKLGVTGLHHKTFQAHLRKVVQVCEDTAAASEADSVRAVKDLYSDLGQPPNNIDVMFDGTWMTRGRLSNIGVGCIIEVYTGLVIDHVVLSNFCLGCAIGPKASDEDYENWLAEHECQRNIDCGAGRMEVEAALIMFKRSLSKNGLRYTTVMSDGDSHTMHGLKEEGVYGFIPTGQESLPFGYIYFPQKALLRANNMMHLRKTHCAVSHPLLSSFPRPVCEAMIGPCVRCSGKRADARMLLATARDDMRFFPAGGLRRLHPPDSLRHRLLFAAPLLFCFTVYHLFVRLSAHST
ncbi:hypothetical protein HPB48_002930 [Haemaphysalis longicornis]|uniref:Mutator-like transposase domain-containing protein n=1 Tax=Haemaphysalis longicornis TaxID=44386 RepID=A0A9J6FGA2_HAELO|nr:hypothetical protein HPB48_002930 [Haemaphysalis longicornis]